MRFIVPLAMLALAAPAAAQAPVFDPPRRDEVLPHPGEVAAMGVAMERMVDALMTVDVGPIMDAADPYRSHPDHGRRGRTLGALGERDDPHFRDRMRAGVRGTTAGITGMIEAYRTVAPQLRRSIEDAERRMDEAMRHVPPPPPSDDDGDWDDWED